MQVLAAPVTIQIAAGSYSCPTLQLGGQPYAGLITIQGVLANPSSVVIVSTDPNVAVSVNGYAMGAITLQGLTIQSASSTLIGISVTVCDNDMCLSSSCVAAVQNGGAIQCLSGTATQACLVLQGFTYGIKAVGPGSYVSIPYLSATGMQTYAVWATSHAEVAVPNAVVVGTSTVAGSRCFISQTMAFIDVSLANCKTFQYILDLTDYGFIGQLGGNVVFTNYGAYLYNVAEYVAGILSPYSQLPPR